MFFPKYSIKNNTLTFNHRGDLFDHYIKNKDFDIKDVSIELPIDDYTFKRNKDVDLFALAKERLLELKATGKKIHFWYSGGIDSHFPLYCMKKFDIWPDTINVYHIDPSDGKIDYIRWQEDKHLPEYLKNYGIPDHVTINVHTIDSNEVMNILNEPDYLKYSSILKYSFIFIMNYFHKVNSKFAYSEDEIHLKGSITPFIYFDKKSGWKFTYSDYQFGGNPYSHITPFIDESPKFLEGYINSIINTLEEKHVKLDRHYMYLVSKEHDRFFKRSCKEISLVYSDIPWVQFGKYIDSDFSTGISVVDLIVNKSQVKGHDFYKQSFDNNLPWIQKYNDLLMNNEEKIRLDTNVGAFNSKIFSVEP